jgi:hypothetical protein
LQYVECASGVIGCITCNGFDVTLKGVGSHESLTIESCSIRITGNNITLRIESCQLATQRSTHIRLGEAESFKGWATYRISI